ncbi:DUF2490 domain-containing protein [Crocinitomix catalasitica]|uniref:DUF2490 domain-containing protein n=1 Tax=Crocinitomix catalasitica TaxID=184607 RepID=UPI000685B998|nr:DUF2490 domain-containing protein [Crocinitomix catalasitica]
MILILLPNYLNAQNNWGNWLMYFGTNKLTKDWSIHSEIQYRNHTVAPVNVEQLLLRTGVNYHFENKTIVTAGYGYIANYDLGANEAGPQSEEHRVFEQFIGNNFIGRLKFEHRLRIEQRWLTNDFKHRFRYRLMAFLPINKPIIEKNTLFVGIYDEIFLHPETNVFDRNRFYAAMGYQVTGNLSFQAGILNQLTGNGDKNYLQFSISFNPNLSI